jgi:hypothetical protein
VQTEPVLLVKELTVAKALEEMDFDVQLAITDPQ